MKDFPFNAQSYETPDFKKSLSPVFEEPKVASLDYRLDDTKFTRKLFKGYPGAEAFTYGFGSFFTGLADGRVMKINEQLTKIEEFLRLASNATSEKCDGKISSPLECGRPLGLEIHKNGKLYVIDAVDGLYSIDLKTKKSIHIPIAAYLANVLDDKLVNNLLFNDLRFDPVKPNLCYITISTTKYKMNQLPFSLLEHENSGLLLAVDLDNKNGSIIAKDLYFTNGLEISSDKQDLYVSETTTFSISKLNLKQFRDSVYLKNGDDQPKLESFLTDLLGEPDNLHIKDGKIYVSFAMIRLNGPTLSDYLARLPVIRNFMSKSLYILSQIIHFLRQTILENQFAFRSDLLKELEFKFNSGHIIYSAVRERGGITIFDEKTKKLIQVIASNEFGFLSHSFVHPKTGEILIGSFKNDFITVVKP